MARPAIRDIYEGKTMPKDTVKTVCVVSPFRGSPGNSEQNAQAYRKNTDLAKRLCLAVLKEGHAPFAPHLLYPSIGLDDKNESQRASGIAAGHAWLAMAAEAWVFARCLEECSEGMRLDVAKAERFSIPPKVVFMPKCWEQFADEMPPPLPKVVRQENPLRGEKV